MRELSLILLLWIFITSTASAQQKARPVKHAHNGKIHIHVLPNNGKGRHSHNSSHVNQSRKRNPVKHAHGGRFHWHVLPNNGRGRHEHSGKASRQTPTKTNTPRKQKKTVAQLSSEQIKKVLIKRSKASYNGSCPCPYNRARDGSSCGRRSAYSRLGGASPLCYNHDITVQMLSAYRSRQ